MDSEPSHSFEKGFRMQIRSVARPAARGAVALALVLAVLQITAPAHATNWGSTACAGAPVNCISLGNNAYHVINWVGDQDIAGLQASHAWARDNVYNPTDMVVYTDGGDPLPDVLAQDEPYGANGLVGWVECPPNATEVGGSHPSRTCRGQYLRYNATYAATDFATETGRRHITCHEMGHTVGLRHRTTNDSCITNTWPNPLPTTLAAHDIAHINAQY